MMIFVPASPRRCPGTAIGPGPGHRSRLRGDRLPDRALGPGSSIEEAEYAALSNAGVLALMRTPGSPRLVLAAEVCR